MHVCHLTHFLDTPSVYFNTIYVLNPIGYFHYYYKWMVVVSGVPRTTLTCRESLKALMGLSTQLYSQQ